MGAFPSLAFKRTSVPAVSKTRDNLTTGFLIILRGPLSDDGQVRAVPAIMDQTGMPPRRSQHQRSPATCILFIHIRRAIDQQADDFRMPALHGHHECIVTIEAFF
jgi:hypothetical protein